MQGTYISSVTDIIKMTIMIDKHTISIIITNNHMIDTHNNHNNNNNNNKNAMWQVGAPLQLLS